MNPLVRQQPRLAATLIAAGVVTASSVVSVPAHREIPTITANVAYASAVTDALVDFGKGVEVVNSLVGIHVDATISVPFEATLAVMAAARYPELAPSVLSFLVQRFVNPIVGDPIHAYPYDTELTVARLAELLPYPLGPSATEPGLLLDGGRIFAEVFNSVLGQLPDPIPGFEAVNAVMNDTTLGGVIVAAHLLTRAPMNIAWNTANYLGYLPATVEATFESALADPAQLPGLVSNLVYGLLSPDPQVGLFGKLLNNAADPFTWLPAPVGYSSDAAAGLTNGTRGAIADAMNAFLSALPAPVTPSALPPGTGPVLGPRGGLSAAKGDESVSATTVSELADVPRVEERPVDASLSEETEQEPAKVETASVETPKADEPKADKSKADKTEANEPKADKTEPSNTEPSKTEADEPKADKNEPSKTEPSKTEPSKTEPSKDDAA